VNEKEYMEKMRREFEMMNMREKRAEKYCLDEWLNYADFKRYGETALFLRDGRIIEVKITEINVSQNNDYVMEFVSYETEPALAENEKLEFEQIFRHRGPMVNYGVTGVEGRGFFAVKTDDSDDIDFEITYKKYNN